MEKCMIHINVRAVWNDLTIKKLMDSKILLKTYIANQYNCGLVVLILESCRHLQSPTPPKKGSMISLSWITPEHRLASWCCLRTSTSINCLKTSRRLYLPYGTRHATPAVNSTSSVGTDVTKVLSVHGSATIATPTTLSAAGWQVSMVYIVHTF